MRGCISILLIDRQNIVRSGIRLILNNSSTNYIVEESQTISDAIQSIATTSFDIVIIDIDTKETDAIKAISRLKKTSPSVKVIVLSGRDKEPFISMCFNAGSDAYLSKSCTPSELIESINDVMLDNAYMSADIARYIALGQISKEQQLLTSLTPREYEVFSLLASGEPISSISKKLHISPKTAYVHRDNIFKKLNTTNLHDLLKLAIRNNVV